MNTNWRNRPTTADEIPEEIHYVVGIDESGSSNLRPVQKALKKGVSVAENEKHFTIAACSFSLSEFVTARDMIMNLKHKYWNNALFSYKGVEKRVCFHSREIRGRREAFNPDIIDYDAFILDLSEMMGKLPMTLFASHIDKVRHVQRYCNPDSPYDLCMTFVLERIIMSLPADETCMIILESRGKDEDKLLLDHIKNLIDYGSSYHLPKEFNKIKGVYFNPKWCKAANDQKSYWQLEMADLCAYPIHKFFVYGTKDKAFQTLLPKVSGYPQYWGRGLKSFP